MKKKNKGNIIANEGKDNRGKWRQISENHYNNRINNRTIKEEKNGKNYSTNRIHEKEGKVSESKKGLKKIISC